MISIFDKIIYISCNPVTLARDVKKLLVTHVIIKVAAFDQFPYTHHLESGVFLIKKLSKYIDEYRDILNNHHTDHSGILNLNYKADDQNNDVEKNDDVRNDNVQNDDVQNDYDDDDYKVENSIGLDDDVDVQHLEKKQKIE